MSIKKQVEEKKRLEALFQPKMAKFLKQLNADTQVIYQATGQLPDFSFYKEDLTALLREHYRKVSSIFSKTTRDSMNKAYVGNWSIKQEEEFDEPLEIEIQEEQSRINDIIVATMLLYIANHSITQSDIILETINREYNQIIDRITAEAFEEGTFLSQEEAAQRVADAFDEKIDGKSKIIALTETQNIAERSKLTEAAILTTSSLVIGGALVSDVVTSSKAWNTILDGRERLHHQEANGQIVAFNQPFIVKGQSLMYPGDTSLGASADNIINCRCTATYF